MYFTNDDNQANIYSIVHFGMKGSLLAPFFALWRDYFDETWSYYLTGIIFTCILISRRGTESGNSTSNPCFDVRIVPSFSGSLFQNYQNGMGGKGSKLAVSGAAAFLCPINGGHCQL